LAPALAQGEGAVAALLALWERLAPTLPGAGQAQIASARLRAATRLRTEGLPSRKDERWHYTQIHPVAGRIWSPPPPLAALTLDPATQAALLPAAHATLGHAPALCFVNGRYAPGLSPPHSQPGSLPPGVTCESLAVLAESAPERLADRLPMVGDGLAAFHAAFLNEGLWLTVAPGTVVEDPIEVLFLTIEAPLAGGGSLALTPCLLWDIGAAARVRIVESHVGLGAAAHWTVTRTDLRLAAGATVDYTKFQRETATATHCGDLAAHLEADARLDLHGCALGGGLAREGIDIRLTAPGAACAVDGLALASGTAHLDLSLRIDHLAPATESDLLWKGIATDAGRCVANSRAVVHPGAAGTRARQSLRAMLLSPEATVDAKPELEILADDVVCSHGATVGPLDEDALFYLRARGLDPELATAMLTYGFLEDLLRRISHPILHEILSDALLARLPQASLLRDLRSTRALTDPA
jgi:Fe-S cluster assembly protein SufD